MVKNIGNKGLAFAMSYFSQESLFCWTAEVLAEYGKLLHFTPTVRAGMVKVKQTYESVCACN